MLDKLAAIEQRYLVVQDELTKSEVVSNMKLMKSLSREYKELGLIVKAYHQYRDVITNIANSKEILAEESDEELKEMAKEELDLLSVQKEEMESEIKLMLIPKDEEDSNNVILEIRQGAGGDEAAIFAGDLFRMYQRFADKKGWKTELNNFQEGTSGGFKEITMTIMGEDAFGIMKYESGVHRVQRVPATESQGRIHTSAATVACMPEMEDVDIEIVDADLRIDTFRASGAGGQHVNKTESAIRITHLPSGMVVSNQDQKSQLKNKTKALKLLKSRLYDLELQKKLDAQSQLRKTFVSTGDRSAKIRTYNYPQGRVTDHRINLTLYNLNNIMNGEIEDIVEALRVAENAEKLKAGETIGG